MADPIPRELYDAAVDLAEALTRQLEAATTRAESDAKRLDRAMAEASAADTRAKAAEVEAARARSERDAALREYAALRSQRPAAKARERLAVAAYGAGVRIIESSWTERLVVLLALALLGWFGVDIPHLLGASRVESPGP